LTGDTRSRKIRRGKMKKRFVVSNQNGRRRVLIWLPLMLGLLVGPPAAPADEEDRPVRHAELLLFDARLATTIAAGVYLELAPGWHLYWVNPGDAGLAPEVRWQVPAGFEPGPLRFPTPEKFVQSDIAVYGHRDDILLLCDIKAPATTPAKGKVTLNAVLDWMACKESCLLGQETLVASLADVTPAGLKRAREIRARFASRFPEPLAASVLSRGTATLGKSPGGWAIELTFAEDAGSGVQDFYPNPIEGFVIANSRISCRDGRISIPVTPSSDSAVIKEISGLLMIDGKGYTMTLPVKRETIK
jgi:DsbC/DsbD-like thiol-disulfide interchange protein